MVHEVVRCPYWGRVSAERDDARVSLRVPGGRRGPCPHAAFLSVGVTGSDPAGRPDDALNWPWLTDAGVEALAAAPSPCHAGLDHTAVSDAGALSRSKTLAAVNPGDTRVTDPGVIGPPGLPKLRSPDVFRLPVTDASFEVLAKAPDLSVR
jgi:hypothetical protein